MFPSLVGFAFIILSMLLVPAFESGQIIMLRRFSISQICVLNSRVIEQ
jgi:hypothetical protein